MKVGTVVMKIAMGNPLIPMKIPVGAIGEIIEPVKGMSIHIGCVAVFFPAYPSGLIGNGWQVDSKLLIPINDPDADITETEEEDLGEFV
jgi:hypothetical protein